MKEGDKKQTVDLYDHLDIDKDTHEDEAHLDLDTGLYGKDQPGKDIISAMTPRFMMADDEGLRRQVIQTRQDLRRALPDTKVHVGGFEWDIPRLRNWKQELASGQA